MPLLLVELKFNSAQILILVHFRRLLIWVGYSRASSLCNRSTQHWILLFGNKHNHSDILFDLF